jgi:hypothetical protein
MIVLKRILGVILLMTSWMTCSVDHGIAPLPGTLGIDVIFLNEEVPENTEGVYLFVSPQFPPHAINELYLSPNSIPLEQDTVYTELALPFGEYEAIGLWWYNQQTQSNLADILTLKLNEEFLPYSFRLTAENPYHRTTLPANLNRVDRDATIRGTIRFNGPFPENTLATAVAAYIQKPAEDVEYFIYLKSMDFSIDSNPYAFTLPVESAGGVGYLAVFWLSDRSGLDDFKTIGFYEDPAQPGQPGSIILKENETITGIDIEADWSLIHTR